MMQLVKIAARRRTESGKGMSRRLRRESLIPAVAYGKELPAVSLAVAPDALAAALRSEHGRNTVVELDLEGDSSLTVMVRDYQYHPVSRSLLHADFVQIHLDQPVDVSVPFELTGKAKGVVLGGTLRQVFRDLPIRCLPERIPVKITYDVTELDLDAHVFASNLELPEGVSVRLPEHQTLVAIVSEKVGEEEAAAPGAAAAGKSGEAAPTAKS